VTTFTGRERLSGPLKGDLFLWAPFRDIDVRNFAVIPLAGNIQVAIAASVFPDVIGAVHTGADDVAVLLPVSRS
jgi:hypothetical protein